ncbi:host specificity protein [Enterobacterales bacterium CwR94]|nr:host specificity protein [Enterobacterales bacterium CwR94]
MTITAIKGRKGGGSEGRTPVEQPDDLQSIAKAKVLLVLGEGEWAGNLNGERVFLDGTPLTNPNGSSNFPGVVYEFRPGTQSQGYIKGFTGSENEISIGTEIKSAVAWTRTFSNSQLSAIRLRLKWPSLFSQQDNGDLVGYEIKYAIDLQTDGGTFTTVFNTAVKGKTTSGYERSHRIDLPVSSTSWTVRIRKLTTDANSAKIGDAMLIQSFTEVIDAKLRYPHSALLYLEFDSSQFNGSIPQISCEPDMRIIRVPDNYDPASRTYTGTWAGAFKWAWTDNPAWIFYDIIISDRFGLGRRLSAANIDKWELYRVAQYCDQMVPDGKGGSGTEPRYICNVYVQSRNEAYTVIRDFAAIFRGMTYWAGNQIVAIADMPRDIDYIYTRANVEDGIFSYFSSTSKTRYTTALVSWSDPANAYADAMEPVFERDLVSRYDFNQLELTAIGCTRQSEANRKGRWGILTNNRDRMVTFSVGLDGMIPQPGYIIGVADEMLSGKVTGGRISSVNGRAITLDRIPDAQSGDRLMLNLPSGASQARTIQSVTGKVVTVTTIFSETPQTESVWAVESDELYAQQYRVISVTDNNDNSFTISGAQHDPDKYDRIDTGAVIDERPISVIPPGNQFPPESIIIDSYSVIRQNISTETMRAQWEPVENAISYEAQWRRNDSNWISMPRGATTSFEVPSVYSGRYLVRVRAINAAEISSGWGYSEEKMLTGKVGNPPKPVGLRASDDVIFGIEINWGFPANTEDTLKTEIQYSKTGNAADAILLSDVPYPQRKYQQMGLSAGQVFFYRAQLVDKSGNESGWTDFVRGQVSTETSEIIEDIVEEFLKSPDGKELLTPIETSPEAIIQNALANNYAVEAEWARFGENSAAIIEARKVASDAQSSVASLETSVTAKFDDTEAALQEKLTAYADANGGSAIYTMKTGLKYNGVNYDAGLSIAAVVNGTQVDTRVAINANKFVIMSGSGDNLYSPFVVQNGQVFINQGFIGQAWIGRGNITDTLQSDNYVYNQAGLLLNFKTGVIENYGAVAGEGKMKQTNTTISIADGSNRLRVQIGRLTGVF